MDEPSAFERWEQDRRFEEAMRMLGDMTELHEVDVLEAAEESLRATRSTLLNDCPAPLEWHPYYRGKSFLIDWLNDDPKCGLPQDSILIPAPPSRRSLMFAADETYPIEPSFKAHRMSKRRAAGPAPYVGRPFVYTWNVGEDDMGRRIAGESRIVYTDGRPGGVL